MPDAKLEIKVGAVTFSGEGSDVWLSEQLDKLLSRLPALTGIAGKEDPETGPSKDTNQGNDRGKAIGTLAGYLKDKKATSNQVRKFLASAIWLHDSEGKNRLATIDVTTALNTHNQGKLTNPAQLLSRNVGKGHIVKDGASLFYVTDDGREELGK